MQLHRARDRFEATGASLVLIGQATPRQAAHFRRRMDIALPVLADETRSSYVAAGAKVATMGELLGPKVLARGALSTLRGHAQGRPVGDPAQLGGAMLIAPGGEVVWSHMSQDASDNARPEEILEALSAHAA